MGLGAGESKANNTSPLRRLERKIRKRKVLVLVSALGAFLIAAVSISTTLNNQGVAEQEKIDKQNAIQQAREEKAAWQIAAPKWNKVIKDCKSKYARVDSESMSLEFLEIPNNPGQSWLTEQSKCIKFSLTGSLDDSDEEGNGPMNPIYFDVNWDQEEIEAAQETFFPLGRAYFEALSACDAWIPESKLNFSNDTYISFWQDSNSYDNDKWYEVRTITIMNREMSYAKGQALRCMGRKLLGEQILNEVISQGENGSNTVTENGMTYSVSYSRDNDSGEFLIIDRTIVDGVQQFN